MVSKNIDRQTKHIKAEKYIFLILIFGYTLGVCTGSFFVCSSSENAVFVGKVLSATSIKMLLYFVIVYLLKYAGVLNGIILTLPTVMGIHNASVYSYNIIIENNLRYENILSLLKDTAMAMLLILYIVTVINQIINKRYNPKKDFKLFITYFIGVILVIAIEWMLKSIF